MSYRGEPGKEMVYCRACGEWLARRTRIEFDASAEAYRLGLITKLAFYHIREAAMPPKARSKFPPPAES